MEMFTKLQLLWINLVTDSIPAIMLAFEKADKDVMENTPSNKSNSSFFTPFLISKIVVSAIFKSTVMIILFIMYANKYDASVAGSLMFIYLIINELLYAFSCRNLKKSVLNKDLFSNKKLSIGVGSILVIQIIILTTDLKKFFIVSNINPVSILTTITVCLLVFIIGELAKPLYTKKFKDYVEVKNEK